MPAFVVAQALGEYGALASKGAGGSAGGSGSLSATIDMARDRLESYIGEGNAPWFLAAVLVLAALTIMFRRRSARW